MLSAPVLIPLAKLSILDLLGSDAQAILHNLTTNDIKPLEVDGPGCETFITNVKGKCIGLVMVYRLENGFRLIGAPGQSQAIAEHADRYTIREDAVPTVLDDALAAFLAVWTDTPGNDGVVTQSSEYAQYRVPWVNSANNQFGKLLLIPKQDEHSENSIAQSCAADLHASLISDMDESQSLFHSLRVEAGYPWYGVDINDSHLPQEADREPQTISFTKGCYLGQETVARLDALGQVQKKLVRWSLKNLPSGELPAVDTKLFKDASNSTTEKPVGRLTSIARSSVEPHDCEAIALGFARRSHFEAGAQATGMIGGHEFSATVVGG